VRVRRWALHKPIVSDYKKNFHESLIFSPTPRRRRHTRRQSRMRVWFFRRDYAVFFGTAGIMRATRDGGRRLTGERRRVRHGAPRHVRAMESGSESG